MTNSSDTSSVAAGLLMLAVVLAFYFLPALIGIKRGVSSPIMLSLINLFAGWTVLGWIVCLLWAVTGATKAQDRFYQRQG